MPQKTQPFKWIKFDPDTVRRALAAAEELADEKAQMYYRRVHMPGEVIWDLDTSDEFFAEYRSDECTFADLHASLFQLTFSARFPDHTMFPPTSTIRIKLPTKAQVDRVFEIFESGKVQSLVASPKPSEPVPFIGHGRDQQWRDLRDHLRDKHRIEAKYFENAPSAGEQTLDRVLKLVSQSNCALLVHTAEDELADGTVQARQNVVNETGIAIAAFGLDKVIVLLEKACAGFTNFAGVTLLPFEHGNISAAFGEVVANLLDKFPRP